VQELKQRGGSMPFVFIPEIPNPTPSADWIPNDEGERSEQRTSGDWLGRALLSTEVFGATEQSIGSAEDMLRTLFRAIEQAADLVVITDTCGVIEYVNPAFEKLTGYSRAEAIRQTPRILKSGEQNAEFYRDP
jgi:PAS domain-containing protein